MMERKVISLIFNRSTPTMIFYLQSSIHRAPGFRYLTYSIVHRSPMIRSATKPSPRPIEPKPDEKEEPGITTPLTPEGSPIPVPEKKKTFVESFINYWKNIGHDYKDVVLETYKEAKEKPKKATIYLIILGLMGYLLKTNPSERHFKEMIITDRLELDLVGMPIRSVKAEKHIRSLAKLQCAGQVRYQSFAFFSVIWKHDVDKGLGIFDSQCSYLRPLLTEIPERVVDIGFGNRWWVSKQKMIDFDINEKEWEEKDIKVGDKLEL